MRRTLLILATALPLAACGWFGGDKKADDQAATAPPATGASSDAVLKRDCTDPDWKQKNLGLWYSVCRQPMKW